MFAEVLSTVRRALKKLQKFGHTSKSWVDMVFFEAYFFQKKVWTTICRVGMQDILMPIPIKVYKVPNMR